MMLNADVRKGGRGLIKCRQGVGKGFFADILYERPLSCPCFSGMKRHPTPLCHESQKVENRCVDVLFTYHKIISEGNLVSYQSFHSHFLLVKVTEVLSITFSV